MTITRAQGYSWKDRWCRGLGKGNAMKTSAIKKTTSDIRIMLYVASFLVLSVSLTLYFMPEHTDVYFAWTINPPLTAAFEDI